MPPVRRGALVLLCGVQTVLVLDVTIVGVALPALQRDLGFSEAGLQWVVSAYVLGFGGLLLAAGRMADVLGRRPVLIAGVALFGAASAACALAAGPAELIAARAVQGAGAALAAPAALSAITTEVPEGPARRRALALWGAAAPLGGALGLVAGGALTQGAGWPAVFWINVPLTAAGIALAPTLLSPGRPAPGGPRRRLDVGGALTGTAGLTLLVLALTRAERAGAAPDVLAAGAGATLALAAFVALQRRRTDPLLALGVFARRPFTRATLVAVLLTATTSPLLFFVTLQLQRVQGFSPLEAGLAFAPFTGILVGASLLAPRAIARVGAAHTMALGLAAIAAGSVVLLGISPSGGYATAVLPSGVLWACGLGAGSVASTTAGTGALPARDQGAASGVLNTAAQVGTALGLAVLVAVAAARTGAAEDPAALVAGFEWAFAANAALAGVGAAAVAASGARSRRRRDVGEAAPTPGPAAGSRG